MEGARIPVNNLGSAACRITPTSSMESAPATIPATIDTIFAAGFAPALPVSSASRIR